MRSASLVGRPDRTERTITSMALAKFVGEFLLAAVGQEAQHPARQAEADGEGSQRDHQRLLMGEEGEQRRDQRRSMPQMIQKVRGVALGKPACSRRRRMVGFSFLARLVLFDVLEHDRDILALLRRRPAAAWRRGRAPGRRAWRRRRRASGSLVAAGEGERHAAEREQRTGRPAR